MKNALIFYFSGTGNTFWVAKKMAEKFTQIGIDAKAVSIETISPKEADELIGKYDIIGFGFPVYGADLPEIMKDFIKSLHNSLDKPAFVFCSVWQFSGGTVGVCADMLFDKGFNVKWGTKIFMPNNVSVRAIPFPYTVDRVKIGKILNKSHNKIVKFVEKIISGESYKNDFKAPSKLSGLIMRAPLRKNFKRFQNDISVDTERCTKCGLCVKWCPSGNLYFEDNKIKTRGNCIICIRCYSFCPESAILYMNKGHPKNYKSPYRGPIEEFNPELLIKKNI